MKFIQENKEDYEKIEKSDNNEKDMKKEEISSDLFNGLNLNNNNEKEINKNEEEDGGYSGFNLMEDNNNKEIKDENIENKIKELNEKIQNAVNVSI